MPAPRARLTVDLDALAANYAVLKAQAGGAETAPVVKADGYGLGAAPIARRLWAEGARTFFVARLEEGEALRAALGPGRPAALYVLDGATTRSAARLRAAGLAPILNSPAQVETYAAFARAHGPLPCGVHIDTGINRLGFSLDEIAALTQTPDRLAGLSIDLVMSHLACADQEEHRMNARQAGRFGRARPLFPEARASLANSAGVFLGPDFLFDLVRPGISLYGGGPFGTPHPALAPVATFEAPILEVRNVAAGDTVGYGARFEAPGPLRVAVIAAGYADGLPRAASPGGGVWFDDSFRPFLGRVSMDLAAVDVTDSPNARPGAPMELFGPNRLLDDAAAAADTVAYELLTRVGARVERVYAGSAG